MKKIKILIVEDEWIVADDLQERLKDLGYAVQDIVSSGEEAVEKVKADTPDLVLMDIQLDGKMNGMEAGKQIQSMYQIPIIYITAFMENHSARKKSGINYYVNKPFDEEELIKEISRALI